MPPARRLLAFAAALLTLKTTAAVVAGYGDYWPADFASDFLRGREGHFRGAYRAAFYVHIASAPAALLAGLALMSRPLRTRRPDVHGRLGRMQAAAVIAVVAPSGLVMSTHAEGGPVGQAGFAALSLLTGATAALGWRAARRRRFASHGLWMARCFALLCSAVVTRVIGGLTEVTGWPWPYAATAWLSWLLPLAALEAARLAYRRPRARSGGTR